jgi:histidinol phosphatase-like PHP family hydrolase
MGLMDTGLNQYKFNIMQRRNFIKNAGIAAGMIYASPLFGNTNPSVEEDFPLLDLHVHTTNEFTIEQVLEIAGKTGVQFGIVEHPASWAIKNDSDLKNYIDKLRKYPVYIGLQPTSPGWSKNFSPALLSQVDYILMDPQRVPMRNGEILSIWQFDTYVDDTDEFMERYMAYTMEILNNEPINIFGWPLFLPVCIARDYYTLWTEDRMQQIISAAAKRNIAIEINDMSHTPHGEFINMAKEQGLKFTFGSDARNRNAGRLAYCKDIAKKCKLTKEDFFIPERIIGKG